MNTSTTVHNKTCHVGVDVSKEKLQIDAGDLFRGVIPNTPAEIAKHLKALQKKAAPHVCCEATGPYDRALVNTCHTLGLPVSRLNPARTASFREAMGIGAKTDKEDARVIRLFAETFAPATVPPPDKTRNMLRQLHLLRDALVAQHTVLSNLRATLDLPAVRKTLDAELRGLDARIEKLEAHIRTATDEAGPAFSGLVDALDGIKGVAMLTATKLAAHVPELGTLTRRRAASLVGLAPFPDESGPRDGPRHIRGGRKPARDALYMAALSASRHNDVLAGVYKRLMARGKHHNVALTAVMRKLFLYANLVAAQHLRSLESPAAGTPPGDASQGAPSTDA